MASKPISKTVLIDNVDVNYGKNTVPQGPLPFHVRVRRLHWWWPGPERYGKGIDRVIFAIMVSPGIVWASVSFGWIPVAFVIIELILIRLTIYRVLNGTVLD